MRPGAEGGQCQLIEGPFRVSTKLQNQILHVGVTNLIQALQPTPKDVLRQHLFFDVTCMQMSFGHQQALELHADLKIFQGNQKRRELMKKGAKLF